MQTVFCIVQSRIEKKKKSLLLSTPVNNFYQDWTKAIRIYVDVNAFSDTFGIGAAEEEEEECA